MHTHSILTITPDGWKRSNIHCILIKYTYYNTHTHARARDRNTYYRYFWFYVNLFQPADHIIPEIACFNLSFYTVKSERRLHRRNLYLLYNNSIRTPWPALFVRITCVYITIIYYTVTLLRSKNRKIKCHYIIIIIIFFFFREYKS
jgi:hypothetical protein